MFTTFDAPSGEACLARREVSNTPLQALTLLNDTVFVEASQALGACWRFGRDETAVTDAWTNCSAAAWAGPRRTRASSTCW